MPAVDVQKEVLGVASQNPEGAVVGGLKWQTVRVVPHVNMRGRRKATGNREWRHTVIGGRNWADQRHARFQVGDKSSSRRRSGGAEVDKLAGNFQRSAID